MVSSLRSLFSSRGAPTGDEIEVQEVGVSPGDPGPDGLPSWVFHGRIEVRNVAFEKRVEVWFFAGEDGPWRAVPAVYEGPSEDRHETWVFRADTGYTWPPEVRFAVRYESGGKVWWQDAGGRDHLCVPEIGLVPDAPVHLVHAAVTVGPGEAGLCGAFRAEVRVQSLPADKRVELHYAVDGESWASAPFGRRCEDADGYERWSVTLPGLPSRTSEVRFAVRCEADGRSWWDNHSGRDYVRRGRASEATAAA